MVSLNVTGSVIGELRKERDEGVAILERLEWSVWRTVRTGSGAHDLRTCPMCGGARPDHWNACDLQSLLKKCRGE